MTMPTPTIVVTINLQPGATSRSGWALRRVFNELVKLDEVRSIEIRDKDKILNFARVNFVGAIEGERL